MKNILYALLALLIGLFPASAGAQIVTTYAGTAVSGFSGDGGAAVSAEMTTPNDVASDATGNIYIADRGNNRIRKVNTSGIITTIAGTGTASFSGDGGPSTAATLYQPCGLAVDSHGNIYIGDQGNARLRVINASGIISTVAGNGTFGYTGDGGPATAAAINADLAIAIDNSGNVFFSDEVDNVVRKINTSGIISTYAGNGAYGYSGNGGMATAARLYDPLGIVIDNFENLYIADQGNNVIRKVNAAGIISTFAGNGGVAYSGDGGPAILAGIPNPWALGMDNAGNLYISNGDRIREINTSGSITTIAGVYTAGYSGDGGPATAAEFNSPIGIAFDDTGNVFIADADDHVIRKIREIDHIAITPAFDTICMGNWVTFTAQAFDTAAPHYRWIKNSVIVGTDSIQYTDYILSTGDTVSCLLLSAVGDTLSKSNKITVVVDSFPVVSNIAGSMVICQGATISLSDTIAGGSWYTPDYTVADLDPVSGMLTGVAGGVANVSYTLTNVCGSAYSAVVVTVNPLPVVAAITGNVNVCVGDTIMLTDVTTGGTWNSANIAATVSATGIVTGVSAGLDTIVYSVGNSCGYTSIPFPVNVLSTASCGSLFAGQLSNGVISTLQITPNPNDGAFTVGLLSADDEMANVIITNLIGEKVSDFVITTNKTFPVRLPCSAGIYFISATTAHSRYVSKVVIGSN